MFGNIVCIAAVLLGIDAGWQPLPEGGVEYLIQIEPQLLETLKSGEPIQSYIPPYVKDVRAYKITVGTGELPRELPPAIPNRVEPDPASKPIVAEPAVHLQPADAAPKPESKSPSDQELRQAEPPQGEPQQGGPTKLWMPLTVTLFTLFGSLGANLYLGWITWDTRSRYRALVHGVSNPALE